MSSGSMEGDESLEAEEEDTDEEDGESIDDYYGFGNPDEDFIFEKGELDPEYFSYSIITLEDVENMLDSIVEDTARTLKVSQICC